MKPWQLYLFAGGCLLLIGFLIGRGCAGQKDPIVEQTTDTLWVVEHDTTYMSTHDTVIVYKGDSIETQVTDIRDSLLYYVNHKPYYQPFKIGIIADNFYGYKIMETPRNVIVDCRRKEPLIRLYGNLAVMVDMDKHLSSEAEGGVVFKNKLSLFGRIEVDNEMEVTPKIGIRIWL